MSDQHMHGGHGASGSKGHLRGVLLLSFSSLGIIYGDIGTSPLYALQSVFSTGTPSAAETLAAVSLIFWTLTLIVLVKYVGIIIRFDDNGEGGTFALYSLMCRAAGFTPFGPAQPEELQETVLANTVPAFLRSGKWWSLTNNAVGSRMRQLYANSKTAQVALLCTVMMATAMVVGDGVLTPSISVLSAISGLKVAVPAIQQGEVIGVTTVVLILLFSVQYLGTAKISTVFAPIICVWLLFNAALGFVNLSTYGWGVWQAVSPHHAIGAFTGPGGFKAGWTLLAGVMLSITGAEAMYADLGHFNAQAVTLSFCGLVYPCLIVTYMGQASYITAHPEAYTDPFWHSVPHGAFWPMLIVATAATVVASQALISGVFSIMRQAMNLGVFPPMKVNHTDAGHLGQIYIGQINFYLLMGCIAMVAAFQDTTALGHAYGVAVMSVMFITTILAGIVMLTCYSINPVLVAAFLILFVPLEGLFLSSNIIKIPEGGWVTIMIAVFVASINLVWWYGSSAKQRWYKTQAAQNKGLLAQVPALADLTEAGDDHNPDGSSLIPTASDPLGTSPARKTSASNQKLGSFSAGQLGSEAGARGGSPFKTAAGLQQMQVPEEGSMARQLRARSCVVSGVHGTSGGLGSREVTFNDRPLARLPGLGIVYTAATDGLPAVLQHMLINLPVMYDVTVLLTVRVITQPFAADQERFLVRKSKLLGMYRVIARYGYMEAIDHGPQFIKQLVACLLRYVAHQDTQQSSESHPSTTTAALAAAAASGTAAVHPHIAIHLHEPLGEVGSQAGSGMLGAAAAAAPASTEPGAAPAAAATGQLAGAASGEGGGEGRAAKALGRWSRVPTAPSDGTMLDEALATAGPKLDTSDLTRSLSVSPNTSLDATTAAALRSSLVASSAVLGKESINRHQYGLQKMSYGAARRREHSSAGTAGYYGSAGLSSGGLSGAPSGGLSGGGVERGHLVTIPALCELTGSVIGATAEGAAGSDGRQNGSSAAADAAAAADRADAAGRLNGNARGSTRLSPAQLREIELLLTCYRTRAVYIMGRALITPSMGDKAQEQHRGLAAAAAHGRKWGVGVVAGAYRFLANNTHPSSQQWLLPDDQLMLVAMVIRV